MLYLHSYTGTCQKSTLTTLSKRSLWFVAPQILLSIKSTWVNQIYDIGEKSPQKHVVGSMIWKMYRWWKKLVSLLNTNVSASFSTRPLFQVSRQLPTAAKGTRVHIMSAELNIKLPASVLLIFCMIQSFNMVSTIQTKTTVHRRDEPEILSTKKRQYSSLSVINGARMRISDHESTIPSFHKLMQVPQCSGATTSFKTLGTYDTKLPPQYACLS